MVAVEAVAAADQMSPQMKALATYRRLKTAVAVAVAVAGEVVAALLVLLAADVVVAVVVVVVVEAVVREHATHKAAHGKSASASIVEILGEAANF